MIKFLDFRNKSNTQIAFALTVSGIIGFFLLVVTLITGINCTFIILQTIKGRPFAAVPFFSCLAAMSVCVFIIILMIQIICDPQGEPDEAE